MTKVSQKLMQAVMGADSLHSRMVAMLMEALGAIWGSFDGWYDDDAVQRAAKLAAEAETRALKQIYEIAAASARELMNQVGAPPASEAPEVFEYPRPVDPVQVWQRPAEQYRYALSEGKSEVEALDAAFQRASHIGKDNAQLTKRNASITQFRRSEKVIGYRRIIHPELSKSGVCGLCIVAADRIYGMEDLLPIHGGCNCSVAPVTKSNDPGLSLNRQDLDALYEAAQGNDYKSLKNIRVTSYEHGELGPVLARVGDNYLTPEEAQKRRRKKKPPYVVPGSRAKDLTPAEAQKRLSRAQAQREAYAKKWEELKAEGISPDDVSASGYVYGLRRLDKEIAKYTKLAAKEAA